MVDQQLKFYRRCQLMSCTQSLGCKTHIFYLFFWSSENRKKDATALRDSLGSQQIYAWLVLIPVQNWAKSRCIRVLSRHSFSVIFGKSSCSILTTQMKILMLQPSEWICQTLFIKSVSSFCSFSNIFFFNCTFCVCSLPILIISQITFQSQQNLFSIFVLEWSTIAFPAFGLKFSIRLQ